MEIEKLSKGTGIKDNEIDETLTNFSHIISASR